ncbi:MAG: PGPGW domain-containing protein [Spirochaetaceae bacterium]|nr:PGPGW domain-containing protein [Spirochaetaceae bacterium]
MTVSGALGSLALFLTETTARCPVIWKSLTLGSAIFFIVTPLLAPALIVLMPSDILIRPRRRFAETPRTRLIPYILWHLVKNLLGFSLMMLGFLLLFMPGQGLLTLFAGTLLADLPFKRRLLARLLGAGGVRPGVEKIRRRFGRTPLIFPENGDL